MVRGRFINAYSASYCLFFLTVMLAGCSFFTTKPAVAVQSANAVAAVQNLEKMSALTSFDEKPRQSSLLGIYVSWYLSRVTVAHAESAIKGIEAQLRFAAMNDRYTEEDYRLLQVFADALQVDIADLLNRSTNRQETLDQYTEALSNVATRANNRFKELTTQLTGLVSDDRAQTDQISTLERDIQTAVQNKDFTTASQKQGTLTDLQKKNGDTQASLTKTKQIVDALDALLTAYGDRSLAIQTNREILIAGGKVVNVPGVKDLKILEQGPQTSPRPRTTGGGGGGIFNFSNQFNGL